MTFEQLAELGIDGEILAAVRLLTHDKSVPYLDYVRKVKENPIAREVKMSDLRDNMDLKRLKSLTGRGHQADREIPRGLYDNERRITSTVCHNTRE